jgi:hypothetical protein
VRPIKHRFERLAGYIQPSSGSRSIGRARGNALFHHAAMIWLGFSNGIAAGTISIFIGCPSSEHLALMPAHAADTW